jgi:hypothetical protein
MTSIYSVHTEMSLVYFQLDEATGIDNKGKDVPRLN